MRRDLRMRCFKLMLMLVVGLIRAQDNDGVAFPDDNPGPLECQLIDGPGRGQKCLLPFVFDNVEYQGCITIADPEQKPWCSTKVDDERHHVAGGGHWGHCDPKSCPIVGPSTSESIEDELSPLSSVVSDSFASCTTSNGLEGECRPLSLCTALSDLEANENACEVENGLVGVCCRDLESSEESIDNLIQAFANAEKKKESDEKETMVDNKVSVDSVNSAVGVRLGFSDPGVQRGEDLGAVDDVEDLDLDESEPFSLHLRFNRPTTEALAVDRTASTLLSATESIKEEQSLSDEQSSVGLRSFDFRSSEAIADICPWIPAPKCDKLNKYRSFDGTCNNLLEANYGRSATPFQRILEPQYSGSLHLPRGSNSGGSLPSARLVSSRLTTDSSINDDLHTVMVMQMGQFIDHDLTHTPNAGLNCCNRNGSFPIKYDENKCFPIPIPDQDQFWQGKKACMSLARSLAAPNLKCSLEYRQQMNQITHWLDGSNIYGSTSEEASKLRQFSRGLLKTTRLGGSRHGALPSCSALDEEENNVRIVNKPEVCRGCSSCFFTGDIRANEQINLLVMHTVWMREHNRVARFLAKVNPQWVEDDERLFQETRRIVIAEYQHIIYKEWLPIVLGNEFMSAFGLWPLSKNYSYGYLDTFDPRISNEFATAAFRFGHSLVPEIFHQIRSSREGRGSTLTRSLRETFFRPNEIREKTNIIDEMLMGMVNRKGELWDNAFVPSIRDHLFESRQGKGGLDLVALNVQRGRDHGLPGYNAYREVCRVGVGRASSFEDLLDVLSVDNVETLKAVYGQVDDIDLFVGGFLEAKVADAIVGPTFKCILGDQFARLKLGDRFFYDLGISSSTRFSLPELQQLRRVSMARVLCDNVESIDEVQPHVFRTSESSKSNARVECKHIPRVQLQVFKQNDDRGN